MLRGRDGKFILRKNGDTYGFYRFTFLPAGLAGEDAAIAEIGAGLGVAESHPVFVGRIQPCPESRQGLVDIFVPKCRVGKRSIWKPTRRTGFFSQWMNWPRFAIIPCLSRSCAMRWPLDFL